MSYYMTGDFYKGRFRGDPGFLSFLGKGLGIVGGLIPGVGGIISKAGGALVKAGTPASHAVATPIVSGMKTGITAVGKVIGGHPVLSAAGAAGAIGAIGGVMAGEHGMVPAGMKGYHLSKKTGKMVKNRHMRVTNPRALRRSLRRIGGFSRLARKVIHITHPRARGRAVFRFKRRKRAA